MAIVRTLKRKVARSRATHDLMQRLVAKLGLAPGKSAPGVLFHWAAVTDGMRAVDVYESRDAATSSSPTASVRSQASSGTRYPRSLSSRCTTTSGYEFRTAASLAGWRGLRSPVISMKSSRSWNVTRR